MTTLARPTPAPRSPTVPATVHALTTGYADDHVASTVTLLVTAAPSS